MGHLQRVGAVDDSIARQGIVGSQIVLYRAKLTNGSWTKVSAATAIEDRTPSQFRIGDYRHR
jgi:hypothetical protein